MKYENIIKGTFVSRPNRFLAHVMIPSNDGDNIMQDWSGHSQNENRCAEVVCHVKNTGRCRELLLPGAAVLVQFHPDAGKLGRKTAYSLIGVYKETQGQLLLINMDSQAPNEAAWEWLKGLEASGCCPFSQGRVQNIRREVAFGQSRLDLAFDLHFHGENGDSIRHAFMEVKGVTLEEEGIAMFPDAPTERGVKHVLELARSVSEGWEAYILLVIQMKGIHGFRPNWKTHAAFGHALLEAEHAGVRILAYDCLVTQDSLMIDAPVQVWLNK